MTPSRSPSPSGSSEGFAAFMEEPADYRPATPPPTTVPYQRRKFGGHGSLAGPAEVEVGLVSGHPLWGHILYPAAIALSRFLELHSPTLLRPSSPDSKGKTVIELGAGGGLPGLVAALEGADKVVISDFPDASLVNMLQKNMDVNIPREEEGIAESHALGFCWGAPPTALFDAIRRDSEEKERKFDLILLSDLVFNHSQHSALLDSCLTLLSPNSSSPSTAPSPSSPELPLPPIDLSENTLTTPAVLCFFSHHRSTEVLIKADIGLMEMAREKGWTVRKVWEDKGAGPAFPEDAGDLAIRGTVHGYAFTRE